MFEKIWRHMSRCIIPCAVICDILYNKIIPCFVDFYHQSMLNYGSDVPAFFLLIRDCLKGAYSMRLSLLGLTVSVSSLLFAVIGFMYSNLKERAYGVTLREIYNYRYGDGLKMARKNLLFVYSII